MQVNKADPVDIFVWPDGSWCYREDFWEYEANVSDDFYVIFFENTKQWEQFLLEQGVY